MANRGNRHQDPQVNLDVGQLTRTRRLDTNMIETDTLHTLIREMYGNMSDKDEKLFRFAKRKISEEFEPLSNVLMMLDFPDAGMLFVSSGDADIQSTTMRRVHIAYDENDKLIHIWKPATLIRTLINKTIHGFEAVLTMIYDANIPASFGTILSNISNWYHYYRG